MRDHWVSNHTEPRTFYCLLLNSPDIGGTIIMADLKNILKHFDEAAENYHERCLSFPWSWIELQNGAPSQVL